MASSSEFGKESGLIYRKMMEKIDCETNNEKTLKGGNITSIWVKISGYLCFCCRERIKRGDNDKKNDFKQKQIPHSFGKALVIGLDGSGKTTLLQRMHLFAKLDKPFRVAIAKPDSTQGFYIKQVMWNNATMEMWEVGGSEAIRKYWPRYIAASRGIVYVIDGKDTGMLQVAVDELANFIKAADRNIPLLVLVNKCSSSELGYIPAGSAAEKVQNSLNEITQLPYNLNIICVSALPQGTDDESSAYAHNRELCRALDWLSKGMF